MSVCNNVTVAGTLINGSTVTMCGTNVMFQPVNLWPLSGSSTPVRLPAIVARQNLRTDAVLSATINGFILVGQQALFDEGEQNSSFNLVGRLITNEFVLKRQASGIKRQRSGAHCTQRSIASYRTMIGSRSTQFTWRIGASIPIRP